MASTVAESSRLHGVQLLQSILCNLEGRVGVADAVWVLTVCSLPVSNSSLLPVARPALYVKVVF
ncbi:hypothetical protein NC653_038539 [Populus alba x Populus x berolinensis]|uniref:Uncharacterized protein n=1 Tax=Populus alba x Populus x berolinensis TaxID=444605 RepID=A0AAD6LH49_9ROSI|nr:hypothetical protein NC653_038539 [Populus alba x Populus x berolinensis]